MTHDIDTRDAIIEDLSARVEAAEAETERLKEEIAQLEAKILQTTIEHCLLEAAQPTAAQERAAIVAWLRSDKRWQPSFSANYASCIEGGEHWPTEGEKP